MVEAPGTAPGSTTLIPRTVYRHSRKTSRANIGIPASIVRESPRMSLTPEQAAEVAAERERCAETRRPTVAALEALLFRPLPVLNHGFVRVIDYMGDDGAIVQAARVSYGRGTRRVSEDA